MGRGPDLGPRWAGYAVEKERGRGTGATVSSAEDRITAGRVRGQTEGLQRGGAGANAQDEVGGICGILAELDGGLRLAACECRGHGDANSPRHSGWRATRRRATEGVT